MNKYFKLLHKVLNSSKLQKNNKGISIFLLNQVLSIEKNELPTIFNEYSVPIKKLADELSLYCQGETSILKYNQKNITWWDYCEPYFINSYPTYMVKLPKLIDEINQSLRSSKNYVLFLGETGVETNQLPCISLIQFQIHSRKLYVSVYQRSADCNLGLPADIYQIMLISMKIHCDLKNITFFIGNAHIYENNIVKTYEVLRGLLPKFNLNV